jgi:hypothetical protein
MTWGRDGLDRETELRGDMRFDARIDVRKGADRARDGAGSDFGARRLQADLAAREFGVGFGELEPEGHGFGVDAMAAADGRREFVLIGAALDRFEQRIEVGEQYVGGLAELDREASVEHVARRHALVHEARLVADILCNPRQEGDDVMLGDRLDRVDRGDVDRGVRRPPVPQRLGGGFRYGAQFGKGVGRVRFDLEPDAKAILGRPDRGSFPAVRNAEPLNFLPFWAPRRGIPAEPRRGAP